MSSRRYVILTPFKKADVLAGICKIHGLDVWIVPSKQGAMVVHDLPEQTFDDWDISELLGGGGSAAPSGPGAAESDAARPAEEAPGKDTGHDPAPEPESSASAENAATETDERPDDDSTTASATLSADDSEGVAKALAKLSRAGVVLLSSELGEDVGQEEGVSGLVTALAFDSDGDSTDTPAGLIVATGDEIMEDLLLGDTDPDKAPGAIRSSSIDSTIIERLAGRSEPGTPLPPRKPRRFFGRGGR